MNFQEIVVSYLASCDDMMEIEFFMKGFERPQIAFSSLRCSEHRELPRICAPPSPPVIVYSPILWIIYL